MTVDARFMAEQYNRLGWAVLILPAGSKSPPKRKGWQNERPTLADIEAAQAEGPINLGILCGDPSGGLLRIDPDCPETVKTCALLLPPTDAVMTRDGVEGATGYFYTVTGGQLSGQLTYKDPMAKGEESTLLDLIWTGRQTVVPPSIHPDGSSYKWVKFGAPAPITDDELYTTLTRVIASALLGRHWPDGGRHDATLALSGGLLNAGWPVEEAEVFLRAVLDAAGDEEAEDRVRALYDSADKLALGRDVIGWPRLRDYIGERIVRRVTDLLGVSARNRINRTQQAGDLRTTDLGNAERMLEQHGPELRFCGPLKRWFVWVGTHWAEDDTNAAYSRAIATVRKLYAEAEKQDTRDKRQAMADWAVQSESVSRILAVESLARKLPELAVVPSALDTDPWILNTPGGALDLRTDRVMAHDPGDLLTKVTGAEVGSLDDCPRWLRFLTEVFNDDEDLVEYVQRAVGYCLTGDTREQVMFLLWGEGRNGKSTFLNTLRLVLGSYVKTTAFDTFDADARRGNPGNDLAVLRGSRVVIAVESDQERRLAEARVKAVTGGDPITCRLLYGEYFEYTPTYKLWLAVNHKPVIRGTDLGIWRRIHFIPFSRTFADAEVDRNLEDELKGEKDGILRWMVNGLTTYRKRGLTPPSVVAQATAEYRREQDILADFFEANTDVDPTAEVTSRELYTRYTYWSKDFGERQMSSRMLSLRLGAMGYTKRKSNGEVVWAGLRLRPEVFAVASTAVSNGHRQ